MMLIGAGSASAGAATPSPSPESRPELDICTNLHFTKKIDPELSTEEKRLACGKGSGQTDDFPEWQLIPASQRKFSVTTFLQARGYLGPKFEIREGKLWVDPGEKKRVSNLDVHGAPPEFDYTRRRHIIGEYLTPGFLDDLKKWTEERLKGEGYACPVIDIQADSNTGTVTTSIAPGTRGHLNSIQENQTAGLMPGLFRRYDAFKIGEWFNGDYLRLAQERVMNEGQVESMKLLVDHCEGDQVYVNQDLMAGKPRLLTLGAGLNTEGYIILRGEWKDVRLGNSASLIDISIQTAQNEQSFAAYANWYLLSTPSRWYLKPSISSDHEHQSPYETLTLRELVTAQTTLDEQNWGFQFGAGPVYEYVKTYRGPGAPSSRFLFLEPNFRVATHYYDFYAQSPRAGFMLQATGDLADHSALSDTDAQEVNIHTEALWNLFQYDPPLIIFGLRGTVATTFVGGQDASATSVPAPLRQYLGGSRDLRGFGLFELPEDQVGRLTSVYGSFETRFADLLPWGLQPFLFLDIGALGSEAASLDAPVFWSPGFGIRWQSPVGTIRTTIAHGYLTGNPDPAASHLQLFFSFGEEF